MIQIKTISEYQNLLSQPGKHVIKVSASWCGPCKVLANVINGLEDSIKNTFVEVDADEADDIIQQLNVRNVPVLIFYDGAKEYNRLVGAVTKDKIIQTFENNIPIGE